MLSRSEYWVRTIGLTLLVFVLPILLLMISEYMIIVVLIGAIAACVVQFVWSVQRFHDVGLSGVWLLLGFVPIVGNLAVFIIYCLPTATFDTYDNGTTGRI